MCSCASPLGPSHWASMCVCTTVVSARTITLHPFFIKPSFIVVAAVLPPLRLLRSSPLPVGCQLLLHLAPLSAHFLKGITSITRIAFCITPAGQLSVCVILALHHGFCFINRLGFCVKVGESMGERPLPIRHLYGTGAKTYRVLPLTYHIMWSTFWGKSGLKSDSYGYSFGLLLSKEQEC